MDKSKIDNQESILSGIEDSLDKVFNEYSEFNHEFNGTTPVKFKSYLSDSEYSVEPSSYLFRFDRVAYFEELSLWENKQVNTTHKETANYIKNEKLVPIFTQLVQAIERKRVAPFIGAGLSIPLGYPSWSRALNDIYEKIYSRNNKTIEQLILNGEFLEAAEKLYIKNKRAFTTYIADNFYFDPDLKKEDISIGALKHLPDISHGCVITTNFDRIIENLFKLHLKSFDGIMLGEQINSSFISDLISGNCCLLKLHGDVGQENTYVFTKSQYKKVYGETVKFENKLPKTLRQIFISHSLLFLGCSLEKDWTLELFEKVMKDGHFEIPQHFAILPKPSSKARKTQKENYLREMNIKTLWYPADKHEYVEKILSLAKDIANKKISSRILKS